MALINLNQAPIRHRENNTERNYRYDDTTLSVDTGKEGGGSIELWVTIEPREIVNTEVGLTINKENFRPIIEAILRAWPE